MADRLSVTELGTRGSPMTESTTAREFLDDITEHIANHGLAEASLRRLAQIAGTSHRMLVYYFGSRDGLLGAVFHQLRGAESREIMGKATSRRDALERVWAYYTEPERELEMRIFFHLAGQAAHGGEAQSEFTEDIVSAWTRQLREVCQREGADPESAQAEARLLVASIRGLLLDRLLTGDEAGTDIAFRRLIGTASGRV